MNAPLEAYERSKLYDLATASPLIVFYGWNVWRLWPGLVRDWGALGTDADVLSIAGTLSEALALIFASLLVVLVVVRTVPRAKRGAFRPRAVAVLGTFAGIAILALPRVVLPFWLALGTLALVAGGTLATIVALAFLGRAFSILPEARRLVTRGPYGVIRHPVYLFELVTFAGIMLQHAQPWAFILFVLQGMLQFARIGYEEEVLGAVFPDYAGYARRTWRLIPWLY